MIDRPKFRQSLILSQVLILALAAGSATAQDGRNVPGPKRGFEYVQIEELADGRAALAWVRPIAAGYDLLFAVRDAAGALETAQRVHATPGELGEIPGDEFRPALATDGGSRVGLAWFDRAGALWVTRSDDAGKRFADPVPLAEDDASAQPAVVTAAFGPEGALHVVWIGRHEDALHAFHAAWDARGVSSTTNLTLGHFESVCATSRPGLDADRHGVTVVLRAVSESFRDVHRMERDLEGHWSAPTRVGVSRWETDTCPVSGPIVDGATVLWRDGSGEFDRVVMGTTEWAALREIGQTTARDHRLGSPRRVGADHILVPGEPTGWLLVRSARAWDVARDDLPSWCVDLVRLGDQWLMIGDTEGKLEREALKLDP